MNSKTNFIKRIISHNNSQRTVREPTWITLTSIGLEKPPKPRFKLGIPVKKLQLGFSADDKKNVSN